MRHDNIARMYGRFSAYSTEFLVVELCDGSDLSRLVERKGAMDEWAVRGVLGQIASALEYVHGRGVIHRDVKPSNVILRPDGVVKLMDFGVAHAAPSEQDTTMTAPGSLFGTMTYMPPEQLAGKEVDARADIYALACLGYQLLTGRPPTAASDIVDLVQQKMSFRLPPRADIGHGVGNEMYDFLERGLSSDPAGRPESITELTAWAAPVRI
jgi:serine/threonine-protein kinase